MNAFNMLKDDIKKCQSKIKIKSDEYYIIKIKIPGKVNDTKVDNMCKTLLLKPCENLPVLVYCDKIYIYLCFSRIATKHSHNGNIGKIISEYSQLLYSLYAEGGNFFECSMKLFSSIPQLYFYLCDKVYNTTMRQVNLLDTEAKSVAEFVSANRSMWQKISEVNKYGFFFVIRKKGKESLLKKKIYNIDGNEYDTYRKKLFRI